MTADEIAFYNEKETYRCSNCRKTIQVTRLERLSDGKRSWTHYACGRINSYSETLVTPRK